MNREMSNEPTSRQVQMQAARVVRPVERGPDRPRRPYDLWAVALFFVLAWALMVRAVGQQVGWWS